MQEWENSRFAGMFLSVYFRLFRRNSFLPSVFFSGSACLFCRFSGWSSILKTCRDGKKPFPFICSFDTFGKGRHIDTFENICREDHHISLGDETTKIFLNADSSMEDVSSELRAFLDYVAGRKSEDDFVKKLEAAVRKARKNRE